MRTFSSTRGFSTIELLIAFSVALIFITGALLVALGSQETQLDATLSLSALLHGSERHAKMADSLFKSWNGAPTTSLESSYHITSYAKTLSSCIKNVLTENTWATETNRSSKVSFYTTKSDKTYATKMETGACDPTPPTEWNAAQKSLEASPLELTGTGTDMALFTYEGTEYAFITTESTSSNTPDLWIIQSTPHSSSIVDELDIGPGAKGVSIKMPYAYVLHASNTEQIKVVDLRAGPLLDERSVMTTVTLPNMTSSCISCLTPKSIAYFDGYLYVGMPYIANLGATPVTRNNELHIICVADNTIPGCAPETPQWLGSFNVNHNIEDLVIQETYIQGTSTKIAYLATSASAAQYPELTIIDVTNPRSLSPTSSVNPSGNSYGTALSLLGNRLYLGRQRTTGNNMDFIALDIGDPWNPTTTSSRKLNLKANTEVSNIASAGELAFVATTDAQRPLHILYTTESGELLQKEFCEKTNAIPPLVRILYHHNTLYALSKSPAELLIFHDQKSCN